MAFTFIKAQGMDIGGSFYEENNLDIASQIISKCNDLDVNLVLPVDAVVSDSIENGHNSYICEIDKIKSDVMGFDIGPKSSEQFKDILYKSKTIVWNGPLGVAEIDFYSTSTREIGNTLSSLSSKGVKTIIGGGDTASALKRLCPNKDFTHISTGGGASLELLIEKKLDLFSSKINN